MNELIIQKKLLLDADTLNTEVVKLRINSVEDLNIAGNYTSNIKKIGKLIKSEYDNITLPHKTVIKHLQVQIKPYMDALKGSEALLKSKILQYSEIAEKERLEKREEALKDVDPFDNNVDLAKYEHKRIDNTSIRNIKDIEIVDESLIPREYLMPDIKKIKADVLRVIKPVEIPGVKKVIRKSVAIRS